MLVSLPIDIYYTYKIAKKKLMIVKIPIKPYNMGDIGIFPFILEIVRKHPA